MPVLVLKGTQEFSEWLNAFAAHLEMEKTEMVVEAMMRMATQAS